MSSERPWVSPQSVLAVCPQSVLAVRSGSVLAVRSGSVLAVRSGSVLAVCPQSVPAVCSQNVCGNRYLVVSPVLYGCGPRAYAWSVLGTFSERIENFPCLLG